MGSKKKIIPYVPTPNKPLVSNVSDLGTFRPLKLKEASVNGAPKMYTSYMRCTNAWTVEHPQQIEQAFRSQCALIGNVKTLYHGTHPTSISSIANEGLRPGRRSCMFGAGIYLGEVNKASGYMQSGPFGCSYLLQVEVCLGKVHAADKARKYSHGALQGLGCHSVGGVAGVTTTYGESTLNYSEWVVYNPTQVLVRKVFEYQTIIVERAQPCALLRKKDVALSKASRAFADLISMQRCGKDAMTKIPTTAGSVYVCDSCIKELKLKTGDKIPINNSTSYWKKARQDVTILKQ